MLSLSIGKNEMSKMKAIRILLYVLIILVATSCMTSHQINYLQTGFDIPTYKDSVQFSEYKLQKGDYLYIHVYVLDKDASDYYNGSQSKTGTQMNSSNAWSRLYLYKIDEDGCIDYPSLGKVKVVDMTARSVKFLLEKDLVPMLKNYSVDVRLASNTFSIIGESGYSTFTLPKEKVTIFEALALAGDLSIFSNRKKIQIIRQTDNGTVIKTFDIRSKSIIDSEFYYIQPNDIIYVPFTNAKLLGITHFTGIFSVVLSTISFGLLVYKLSLYLKSP